MKKISVIIMVSVVLLTFCSCGVANGSHGGVMEADEWPLTDYPEPKGAKVVSVEKNYNGVTVGVVWDNADCAKSYAKTLEKVCGTADQPDPSITETDKEYTYTSYKFTVSFSEKEDRLNYIHIY